MQDPITLMRVSEFSQNRYITYPHCNGFADQGQSLVLGQRDESGCSLWKRNLDTGTECFLASFPLVEAYVWFDIATEANILTCVADNRVWLQRPGDDIWEPLCLYTPPLGAELQALPSITADGTMVLVGQRQGEHFMAVRLDTQTSEPTVLFEHDWYANHFHFCPHDPSWIGYCHEGATEVPDRVWAWHARDLQPGRCIFSQQEASVVPGKPLYVGHERWCFHTSSALAVAYAVSPGEPRGLYEVFPDKAVPRLVSPGERDWHCNVSRDGRWAVVDTTGPHAQPGRAWDADWTSDILLVDMQTGERRLLAQSHPGSAHPAHPHPAFSPDGRWLVYNEGQGGTTTNQCRVWAIQLGFTSDLVR